MYAKILITLDATRTDRAIIEHIKKLAKYMGSRVVLMHVATGAAAQWHGEEAAGEEVEEGRVYLEGVKAEFEALEIPVTTELAYGAHPAKEIVKWVNNNGCDLVAMSTHGHRMLGDLFLGTTAHEVRHSLSVPILLLRAT